MTAVRPTIATGLSVTLLIADGTIILSVAGTVDCITSPILASRIANALVPGARTLIVDLRRVVSFSSAGTEVLACTQRSALPTTLVIVADTSTCRTGCDFDYAAVNRLVPLYASLEEALAASRR